MKKTLIFLAVLHVAVLAQTLLTDPRDNKTYKTTKIGEQVWMAKNLNYNASGSKCYDNQESNCQKYGRLYNWNTAMTACPSGWRLPSDAEWNVLMKAVGGDEMAGKFLKATSGWKEWSHNGSNYPVNGTDDFGFAALPGGGYAGGSFNYVDINGLWWSASENDADYAYLRRIGHLSEDVRRGDIDKSFLLSVRCVQESNKVSNYGNTQSSSIPATSTFKDTRDNKTYKMVKIGSQTWLAENLNYNASGSKCYDNQESNCQKYGRLYNWTTAKTACPKSWHLPSEAEWKILRDYAGGYSTAGIKLKTANGWNDHEGKSGNGEDKYGFSALPGGGGSYDGDFLGVGYGGRWWSSEYKSNDDAYCMDISYDRENSSYSYIGKNYLFSVRCVKD